MIALAVFIGLLVFYFLRLTKRGKKIVKKIKSGNKSKKNSPDMFMILGGLLGGFVLCFFIKNNNNLIESHCGNPDEH